MTALGFGIDFGGTGTKGAPVNLETGELAGERFRIPTPHPATPHAVAEVVAEIVANFDNVPADRTVGIAIPAVVKRGVALSAANIDKSWIDFDADGFFTERLGRPVHVVNDADAAGVAEARYGAAKGVNGLVCLLTLGTGIGSALLIDGKLVPNTEFGHLWLKNGMEAEKWAAASVREKKEISWHEWAERVDSFIAYVERIFSPDLFLLSGGVSKKPDKWLPYITSRTELQIAEHRNNAGIIGAAALGGDED